MSLNVLCLTKGKRKRKCKLLQFCKPTAVMFIMILIYLFYSGTWVETSTSIFKLAFCTFPNSMENAERPLKLPLYWPIDDDICNSNSKHSNFTNDHCVKNKTSYFMLYLAVYRRCTDCVLPDTKQPYNLSTKLQQAKYKVEKRNLPIWTWHPGATVAPRRVGVDTIERGGGKVWSCLI